MVGALAQLVHSLAKRAKPALLIEGWERDLDRKQPVGVDSLTPKAQAFGPHL